MGPDEPGPGHAVQRPRPVHSPSRALSRVERGVCPSPRTAERFSSNEHRATPSPRSDRCISPSESAEAGSPSRTSAPPPHPEGARSSLCLCHSPPGPRARPSALARPRSTERARASGRGERRVPRSHARRRPLRGRADSPRTLSAPSSSSCPRRSSSRRSPWNCAPTRRGRGSVAPPARARQRDGAREGEETPPIPDLESRKAERVPSAPRMTSVESERRLRRPSQPLAFSARRPRDFAARPLDRCALIVSSFGARESTQEVAFGPTGRAIYRVISGEFTDRLQA